MKKHLAKGVVCAFIVVLSLAGCSSMKPVNINTSPQELQSTLNPGDKIIVETKNKTKQTLTVDSVRGDGITADGQYIPYTEITALKRKEVDALKTGGAVVGGIAGYYLIGTLIVLGAIF